MKVVRVLDGCRQCIEARQVIADLLQEIIRRKSVDEHILLRTVFDYKHDNFGGFGNFCQRIESNGHDRTDSSSWGIMPLDKRSALARRGYAPRDVIWARPVSIDMPNPFMKQLGPEVSYGLLILDPRCYAEEFPMIYAQKDVRARRDGLLGAVLVNKRPSVS